TGSERSAGVAPSASGNPVTSAYDDPPRQAGGTPGRTAPAPTTPSGKPSPDKKPVSDTPSRPEAPSTTPDDPATTPPATTP
ncbi:CAP domain-containing protein, partial [Actinomadura bangladeshensis]|nr:CAP domain-containing protein [Actinomadura bangladeshensis]